MSQQRIDRSGNQGDSYLLQNVDSNFDDLFDVVQVLDANYTFQATTAAQKLLNASPNGALNLPVGLYEFECMFDMVGLSSSSSAFGFALGGSATIESQKWTSVGDKATRATSAATQSTFNNAANTAIVAASTTTEGWAYICGLFRLSAPGTIIPQVSFTVITGGGGFPTVNKNSFFRAKKLNQNYQASIIQPPMPRPSPNTPFWS